MTASFIEKITLTFIHPGETGAFWAAFLEKPETPPQLNSIELSDAERAYRRLATYAVENPEQPWIRFHDTDADYPAIRYAHALGKVLIGTARLWTGEIVHLASVA